MNNDYFTNDQPFSVSTPDQPELVPAHDTDALWYCLGGAVCLLGAWFTFAIPLSLLAIHLGRKGKERWCKVIWLYCDHRRLARHHFGLHCIACWCLMSFTTSPKMV